MLLKIILDFSHLKYIEEVFIVTCLSSGSVGVQISHAMFFFEIAMYARLFYVVSVTVFLSVGSFSRRLLGLLIFSACVSVFCMSDVWNLLVGATVLIFWESCPNCLRLSPHTPFPVRFGFFHATHRSPCAAGLRFLGFVELSSLHPFLSPASIDAMV